MDDLHLDAVILGSQDQVCVCSCTANAKIHGRRQHSVWFGLHACVEEWKGTEAADTRRGRQQPKTTRPQSLQVRIWNRPRSVERVGLALGLGLALGSHGRLEQWETQQAQTYSSWAHWEERGREEGDRCCWCLRPRHSHDLRRQLPFHKKQPKASSTFQTHTYR